MNAKRQKLDPEGVIELITDDKETEGFDLQAGQTWTYPTNYSLRDYQYSIIQEALLKNTMVSLPTGLGKTFIAAVVMYNFYRWYPSGKIIFMAPTRPLVKQQIDACYNIMAIPKEVTAELTGTKVQESRKDVWNQKRVFFITPQVLQNDLNIFKELGLKIKCLVIDEAHKAKGNHAYCEVIRKLKVQNKFFRVLALSATPGNTVPDVIEVIDNLLIAHLEFRTDDSPDVVPYIFERSLETVVIPLDDILIKTRDDYIKVLEKYTKVLMQHKVLMGNCSTLTKGKIFMTMKNYQETNRQNRDSNYNEIMKYLNICQTLYYAFELLLKHGLRSFLIFFEDRLEKSMLSDIFILRKIIQEVEEYMGPLLNIQTLPDGSITGIPENVKFGHPKFYKLRDITCDHFQQDTTAETRVIIFCEYRETVMEAYGILSLSQPLIKPRIFMGKSSITQKQQLSVIKAFRDGTCNTLISTCIGEEGIDVGNVDLIICFDISNKSPIRMIQRMGRTGRKRQGRVVILVTEGREQQTLKECLIQKQSLAHHILQPKSFQNDMYRENPRMIPENIEPKCTKMFITVKQESNQKTVKSKSKNIKDMFNAIAEENKHILQNASEESFVNIQDKLPIKTSYWDKGIEFLKHNKLRDEIDFVSKLSKLRVLQHTEIVDHSSNTNMLVSLLQSCESKKFNIPITQTSMLIPQTQRLVKKADQVTNKAKQTDIRNMFNKQPSSCSAEASQAIDTTENDYPEIILINDEINNYSTTLDTDYNNNCKICTNLFTCTHYYVMTDFDIKVNNWIEPDTSIYDNINEENLLLFEKSLTAPTEIVEMITTVSSLQELHVTLKDDEFDDTSGFIQSPFKAPRNIQNVLNKCNVFDSPFPRLPFTQLEVQNLHKIDAVDDTISSLNMTEFNNVEFTQLKQDNKNENKKSCESGDFISITELEDIFESSFKSVSQTSDNNATIIYSLNDCDQDDIEQDFDSPILTCNRNLTVRNTQADNKLNEASLKSNLGKEHRKTISFSSDEDDIRITSPILSNKNKSVKNDTTTLDIGDICDLHTFGLDEAAVKDNKISSQVTNTSTSKSEAPDIQKKVLDKSFVDFCDESLLDMFYNNPFFESKMDGDQNEKSSVLEKSKNEELSTLQNNSEANCKIDMDRSKQWENDIWNFCMDDDTVLEEHTENHTPNSNSQNAETDNNNLSDVIDLTSDHSMSPPTSRSPSLIKSQRYNIQKSPPVSHKSDFLDNNIISYSPNTQLQKKGPKNVLALKKHSESKNFEKASTSKQRAFNQKPSTDLKLSPVLYKHVTDDSITFKKPTKKLELSDDDDDFEVDYRKDASWIRPKITTSKQAKSITKESRENLQLKKKPKPVIEDYIHLEAEVSGVDSGTDEGSCLDDSFEKSFVDDNTEGLLNTTIVHAQYLKSIKDTNRGQFKIPHRPASNVQNVFSQPQNLEDSTYLYDSFCVSSQDIERDSEELSELELAEICLKQKKKTKKGKSKKPLVKRKRILESSSDSE